MPNNAIVCFRNDLRLEDNPALSDAINQGMQILPVFIYDPLTWGDWGSGLGGASKWWLHESIKDVQRQLEQLGGYLVLRKGATLTVMQELVKASGASMVFWNRRYSAQEITIDSLVKKMLEEEGVEVRSFKASLLEEPWTTANKQGNPFKVYSPFWRSIKDRPNDTPLTLDREALSFSDCSVACEALEDLELLPKDKNWHLTFHDFWDVSEAKANRLLEEFISEACDVYDVDRDRPDLTGTSFLSPYLRWGQISPRQIAHRLAQHCNLKQKGPLVYLKEIYWREFAYYVLYHFPNTPSEPLQEKYKDFPWKEEPDLLKRWQKGQTGYPIVDAGMRQLYASGWMHNRVRMIVASFLVKHMLHSWNSGAAWFWDTLVDADLASNTLGWQWSGGCGADAAPYFRIFNPMIQGMKFDPEGRYVKRWVPELADLGAKHLHQPWEASDSELREAGVELGVTYPKPIIEHSFGRERALEALASLP
jgi:deoxyribodipyrimidine photo-lyase